MPNRPPSHKPARPRLAEARPTSAARGYDADWRRLRLMHLRAHPLCVTPGCNHAAAHVDHIVSIDEAPERRLDPTNLQSLCASCHSKKTCAVDHGFGRKKKRSP
jgi:5-methylcytosine-specific restriction protein A